MPRPDDGLIHAWLDGQLPPEEAARIEALAAADPEWAAAVAEARGLVAASSRILSALDHVPAGVVPKSAAARTARRLPWWAKMAAAVVLVAGGSVVVVQRLPDTVAPGAMDAAPGKTELAHAPAARTEQPAGGSAAPKRGAPPTTVVTPPPAPVPAVSNAEQRSAPSSVAQEATRAALAEPQAKAMERVVVPQVASPAPNMLVENAKDAAFEAKPAARRVAGVAGVAGVPEGAGASGVAGAARLSLASTPAACFRIERDRAPAGSIGVMRTWRTDGDTLRLEPAQDPSPLRAWIVRRDDAWRGAAVPVPAGRDTIPVIAVRVACPAP